MASRLEPVSSRRAARRQCTRSRGSSPLLALGGGAGGGQLLRLHAVALARARAAAGGSPGQVSPPSWAARRRHTWARGALRCWPSAAAPAVASSCGCTRSRWRGQGQRQAAVPGRCHRPPGRLGAGTPGRAARSAAGPRRRRRRWPAPAAARGRAGAGKGSGRRQSRAGVTALLGGSAPAHLDARRASLLALGGGAGGGQLLRLHAVALARARAAAGHQLPKAFRGDGSISATEKRP